MAAKKKKTAKKKTTKKASKKTTKKKATKKKKKVTVPKELDEFKKVGLETYGHVKEEVTVASKKSKTWAKENPVKAVAAGVGIGFLLGKIFRRRKKR